MKELYIDFDGVILDTIPLLYSEVERLGIDKYDKEFYKNFDYKKILKDENILNDSINCIHKLIKSKKFSISILTHIASLDEGVLKVHYIRKHFNDITIILVPKEVSKTKMIHTKGAILVDDYAGNLRTWQEEGGICVRFNKELEDKGFTTINKLDQLLDLF